MQLNQIRKRLGEPKKLELIVMEKLRIAIATKGREGLEDVVSKVFGRSSTFTIVNVDNEEIGDVKIMENPAVSYKFGAGPIVVKNVDRRRCKRGSSF